MEPKEEESESFPDVKQDPESEENEDDDDNGKEGADIRDIRYNLEKLCANLLDRFYWLKMVYV